MAKFMDVHSGFVGVTEEQLREAHERDLAIEDDEGVHFERAWLDPESGKVFCLSTGPSQGERHAGARAAGHPTAEVYEVSRRDQLSGNGGWLSGPTAVFPGQRPSRERFPSDHGRDTSGWADG